MLMLVLFTRADRAAPNSPFYRRAAIVRNLPELAIPPRRYYNWRRSSGSFEQELQFAFASPRNRFERLDP
jgi:hypothetical protein